jgi:uracil-DNA glycosylase
MTIDARSAAFLQEMGITPLWTPRHADAGAAEPLPDARPAPLAEPGDIAAMDWAQLRAAIQNCQRCSACKGGSKPVPASGPERPVWFVVAGAATASDVQEGRPVSGEAGKLFDNMLAAVGLDRAEGAYVTNVIKCRPLSASGGDRAPTAEEAASCRPYLERELALSGAPLLLTVGQVAANSLLGKPLQEPLAGTRGTVHRFGHAPMVATLHPGELLRRPADKALAWADLCLARGQDGRPA